MSSAENFTSVNGGKVTDNVKLANGLVLSESDRYTWCGSKVLVASFSLKLSAFCAPLKDIQYHKMNGHFRLNCSHFGFYSVRFTVFLLLLLFRIIYSVEDSQKSYCPLKNPKIFCRNILNQPWYIPNLISFFVFVLYIEPFHKHWNYFGLDLFRPSFYNANLNAFSSRGRWGSKIVSF